MRVRWLQAGRARFPPGQQDAGSNFPPWHQHLRALGHSVPFPIELRYDFCQRCTFQVCLCYTAPRNLIPVAPWTSPAGPQGVRPAGVTRPTQSQVRLGCLHGRTFPGRGAKRLPGARARRGAGGGSPGSHRGPAPVYLRGAGRHRGVGRGPGRAARRRDLARKGGMAPERRLRWKFQP